MIKRFRAWDGEEYWYTNEELAFVSGDKHFDLSMTSFGLKDVDMFIGKADSKGVMIYENDLLVNPHQDASKVFQVVWSDDECGFRKVPYGLPYPETKIDDAFMEVTGTIHT